MCYKSSSQIDDVINSTGLEYESATNHSIKISQINKLKGGNFYFGLQLYRLQTAGKTIHHVGEYRMKGPACLIGTKRKTSYCGPSTRFKGVPSMILLSPTELCLLNVFPLPIVLWAGEQGFNT